MMSKNTLSEPQPDSASYSSSLLPSENTLKCILIMTLTKRSLPSLEEKKHFLFDIFQKGDDFITLLMGAVFKT